MGLDVLVLVSGYGAYSNHGSDGVSICGGAGAGFGRGLASGLGGTYLHVCGLEYLLC
jgi:hypothetical protein